jgi:hypothetical protein
MECRACGLSYPGDVSWCPECGTVAGSGRPPEFLPLRALANILTVLLAVVVAAIVARLGIRLLGPESTRWQGGYVVQQLDKAADITIFGLSILFVVWFRRARINAEYRGWRQRRARGWAFWGWIVPVVSLWFPFQIMGDIWRAGRPASRRNKTAWLPALWWASWLLSGVTIGTKAAQRYSMPHLTADTWTATLCFLAVSGATLIALIRTVSSGPVGSPHQGAFAPMPAGPPS